MIQIRDGLPNDCERIATFQEAMAQATEDKRLDAEVLRAGVRAALVDPGRGLYLVAERGEDVAGSLLVTHEWSDWRNGWFWWIQSVWVEPQHRGHGVYRALHEAVRARARAAGDVVGIRLYVERDNGGAQRTYAALGMTQTAYRLFEESLQSP